MVSLTSSVNCRRKLFSAAAHVQPHFMADPLLSCRAQ